MEETKLNNIATKLVVVVGCVMTAVVLWEDQYVAAEQHIVGDKEGWTLPDSPTTYSSWASTRKFYVGDTLAFMFKGGFHSVARVDKEAFDVCDTSDVQSMTVQSPYRVPLNSKGMYYFICTIGDHCLSGEKLAVDVIDNPNPSPPPPPLSPLAPLPPPPPPPRGSNHEKEKVAGGVSSLILTLCIFLWCYFCCRRRRFLRNNNNNNNNNSNVVVVNAVR